MASVKLEGREVAIDIANPSEDALRQLEDAYRHVERTVREKGGRLVVQPTASGVRILRAKEVPNTG